jgi:hypothetical protein
MRSSRPTSACRTCPRARRRPQPTPDDDARMGPPRRRPTRRRGASWQRHGATSAAAVRGRRLASAVPWLRPSCLLAWALLRKQGCHLASAAPWLRPSCLLAWALLRQRGRRARRGGRRAARACRCATGPWTWRPRRALRVERVRMRTESSHGGCRRARTARVRRRDSPVVHPQVNCGPQSAAVFSSGDPQRSLRLACVPAERSLTRPCLCRREQPLPQP